jgi:hypothetical protein
MRTVVKPPQVGDRVFVHWGPLWRKEVRALGPRKGTVKYVTKHDDGSTSVGVVLDQQIDNKGAPNDVLQVALEDIRRQS